MAKIWPIIRQPFVQFSEFLACTVIIDNEQFISILRSALHHLYDPDHLRRSPLASLFDLTGRVDAPFVLQKLLIDAIESMQPDENELAPSRGWLLHDVLYFRYVRGYGRQDVANQLGISERQFSRDQRTALETLAQYLWKTYRLDEKSLDFADPEPQTPAQSSLLVSPAHASGQADEQAWAEAIPADRPAPWKATFQSALELLQPLLSQNEVELVIGTIDELPDLLAPQNALRHSLLNIFALLTPLAARGKLTVSPGVQGQALTLRLTAHYCSSQRPNFENPASESPGAAAAAGLIESAGGSLQLLEEPDRTTAILNLPARAQIPVLVIDDNAELIQLFQRYGQGTRYTIFGATRPAEFFHLLEKIHPRIIIMDLMMADLDGWELLSRLRQEHRDQNLSIIICSILPQKDLAFALGANGFLQKPVLPQDFLQALDEQVSQEDDETKS
ncbi:MAG: response regulator [Chloroflexi bacterium]|nr:response regulator [Chloroflexota bacterium]